MPSSYIVEILGRRRGERRVIAGRRLIFDSIGMATVTNWA